LVPVLCHAAVPASFQRAMDLHSTSTLAVGNDHADAGGCAHETAPCVSKTLASVCHSYHFSPPSSASSIQRPRTTPRGRQDGTWRRGSRLSSPRPSKKFVGEPRASDKRGYTSLEEVLSSTGMEPEDAAQDFAEHASARIYNPKRMSAERVRKSDIFPSELSQPRVSAGDLKGRGSLHPPLRKIEDSVMKSLKVDMDMSNVSNEWTTMLALATRMPNTQTRLTIDADGGGGDCDHKDMNAKRSTWLPSHARMTQTGPFDGEDRPESPLRPGVYMGRHGQQNVPVLPPKILLALPGGIGQDAMPPGTPGSPRTAGSPRLVDKLTQTGLNSTTSKLRSPTKTWAHVQKLLEQDDTDENLANEREQYNLWKKKVIESARTLQLEVSRFHTSA